MCLKRWIVQLYKMADIYSIFRSQYARYLTSLKETSFDKENSVYLCNADNQEVYDFDRIVKEMYPDKQPASYDAFLLQEDTHKLYCIEFKNQRYSDIDRQSLKKKIENSYSVLKDIFKKHHIQRNHYKLIFCVVYRNEASRWQKGIAKNVIQFGLKAYQNQYFNEVYTNDIDYFTHEYKKLFRKGLNC